MDGVVVQSGGTAYTLSNIQAAHTVEVTFKQHQYIVTPSLGLNGSIQPDSSITINSCDNQEFTAYPNIGYMVNTWYLDGTDLRTSVTTYTLSNIQADHTVHVTFEKIWYTVTLSSGKNGSIQPDSAFFVDYDDDQEFIAYPHIGYEVDKWYLDGTVVQIGGITYTLSSIQEDYEVHVTFKQMPTYSLGNIEFDGDEEFDTHIIKNNFVDQDNPEVSRIHIERVEGLELDPAGVMLMHNLQDLDPTSPAYGRMIHARVKGLFVKTNADEILIRFKYLFTTSKFGVELVVYLSDSPRTLDP